MGAGLLFAMNMSSRSLSGAFAPSIGTLGTYHTARAHRLRRYHKTIFILSRL